MAMQGVDGKMQIDGRPLRVLHIGNIANNAFNIAKLQREAGIEADVLCYNYYHIMGSPEWEDAHFDGEIPDQYYPKWHKVNLNGYVRPEWFVQGDFISCVKYLIARNHGNSWIAAYYRLRMILTQRHSSLALLFDVQSYLGQWSQPTYLAEKMSALMTIPERVSRRMTNWLCKKIPILRPVSTHLDFAIISLVMLTLAFFMIAGIALFTPLLLSAQLYLVMRKLFKALIGEVRDAAPSRRLAVRGFTWWSSWSRMPFSAVASLANALDERFQCRWFRRVRGYLLLATIVVPIYAVFTLVIAVLALSAFALSTPFLLLFFGLRCLRPLFYRDKLTSPRPSFEERCQDLMRQWNLLFPHRPPLTSAELQAYQGAFEIFQELLFHYDIVQGYATDPMWPLLCGKKPYVAYEHGTLREIPFQDTVTGKLTALAYRLSQHTFITNGDCQECALRLGVPKISPTLHGIDDRKFHRNQELRETLRQRYGVNRLYLCPIRHDWSVKGTDQHIRALPNLIERTGTDFRLIMIEWGEMVTQSKELARSLDVEGQIVWIQPLPKRKLIDWIGAMDCILDQMTLPHFGATAPEAMGCGVPVISSYDPASTRWIVAEPAPILSAFRPEQIADQLARLADPGHWEATADQCLEWFRRNHSSQRLLKDHLDVYRDLLTENDSTLSRAA